LTSPQAGILWDLESENIMKQNIYYTIDEETGKIIIDLYEMEQAK